MNTQMNIDTKGNRYNPIIIMAVILLATFAGALMQTSLGTALPTLMTEFNIDLNTAQQATTWFLLANGIMVPVSAYLATRFSTKWLHIFSYSALFLGLVITVVTPSEEQYWFLFIIGRVITAIAVGIMMPLMQILIVHMFPSEKRAIAMGLSGLAVGLAPAMGPTFAGWILDKHHVIFGMTISDSWRNIFVIPIIVVGLALVIAVFFMRDVIPNKKIKLDVLSLVLSTTGFGLFLYGFTNVATEGWTDLLYVILPIFISLVLIIWFGIRQLKLEEPLLNIRVFNNCQFVISTLALVVVTMAMYGIEMMLPTYLQNIHGYSPFNSGLILLAGALMMGFVSPISGSLYNKVGIKRLTFVGFLILFLGSIPFAFLTDTTSTSLILVLYAVRMFGVAVIMMPLTTYAMEVLPIEESTHATAVNNTARQIASAIGVALLTSITQNIITNHMPSTTLKNNNPLEFAEKAVQASMDGFNTAFLIGAVFALLGLCIVPLLKQKGEEL